MEYDGSTIGKDEIYILNHFFASEIRWASDSQSATWDEGRGLGLDAGFVEETIHFQI